MRLFESKQLYTIKESFNKLKSPIILDYFTSLLGIGYDSNREKTLTHVLIVSSIFLSITSGYTTFNGLCEYVPSFIAVLATFGIQGLLFSSSWRIGVVLVKTFKPQLLLIFIITLCISVFFSYSALLNQIYSYENRSNTQLNRAKINVTSIFNEKKSSYINNYKNHIKTYKKQLNDWNQRFNIALKPIVDKQTKLLEYNRNEYKKYEDLYHRELNEGGTVTEEGYVTGPGVGTYSKQYKKKYEDYYSKYLIIKHRNEKLNGLVETNNNLVSTLLSKKTINDDSIVIKFRKNYNEIVPIIASNLELKGESKNIFLPDEITELFDIIKDYSEFNEWSEINCNFQRCQNINVLKNNALQCIDQMPLIESEKKSDSQKSISEIGRYYGKHVHHFSLAVNELSSLNVLAIGSLIVALSIDCLILFCGLLAARPESFLNMTSAESLADVQELAIETVFALDLSESFVNSINDPYVKKLAIMLQLGQPDIELAYSGMPIIIENSLIATTKLSQEIGVLISLQFANKINEFNDIGLRTRFVLWASEQIVNYKLANKTTQNLSNSIT